MNWCTWDFETFVDVQIPPRGIIIVGWADTVSFALLVPCS